MPAKEAEIASKREFTTSAQRAPRRSRQEQLQKQQQWSKWSLSWNTLKCFDHQVVIRVDTNIRSNVEAFPDDLFGRQPGCVLFQGQSCRLGVHSPGTYSRHLVIRLQHVARARQYQQLAGRSGDEHGLQPP